MQSKDSGIRQLKLMTTSFKQYLMNYNLWDKSNQDGDKFEIQNNFLSKNSCVLSGSKIFEIMFFGTKFTDIDTKTQQETLFTLKEHWTSDIETSFTAVIADISTLKNDVGTRTSIEVWFDVLKKVMRMYKNDDFQKALKQEKEDHKGDAIKKQMGGQEETKFVEKASDDFYIYIYDEEEN